MNSTIRSLTYTLFFLSTAIVTQAQTIKLNTSEGYINTEDSVRLYYNIVGTGIDTLMIIHGGPYNSNYLLSDIKPLAAHHTLLFYDQRSAGYSTLVKDTARLNFSKYLNDIETVRKYFNIDKINLLGHSKGGLLAGHYAATHPNRVKSMILINPSPLTNWKSNYSSKMDSMTTIAYSQNEKKFKNSPVDSTKSCWDYYALEARYYYPSAIHARRMWGDVCNSMQANMLNPNLGYMGFTIKKRNIIPELAKIEAPVLVLAGDQDYKPFGAFEEWKESLPNSRIVKFSGSGHFPHVDDPDLFFESVEQFLIEKFSDKSIINSKGAGVILSSDDKGTPYQQARAAIIGIENNLVQSLNKGDWAGAAALYSTDGVIYAPGSPPIKGTQAIASFWHTVSIRGMHTIELQLMDLEASGDLLVARGKYVMRDTTKEFLDIGKFVALYRKEDDKWLLQTDIFNSSLETRSPISEPDYLMLDKQ